MAPYIDPNPIPSQETKEILEGIEKRLGKVPNIFKTFAHSNAVLRAYLGFSDSLSHAKLSPTLREQIALTVAEFNSCEYCKAAHTVLGGMAGLDETEITRNLRADSSDPKVAAALVFAKMIVGARGRIRPTDLEAVRAAGYDEEEIVEIIAVVALNLFTNYFNLVAGTKVDFPLDKL